ncbi:hypothetical protein MASR1M59_02170 [Melaminivora sp.]
MPTPPITFSPPPTRRQALACTGLTALAGLAALAWLPGCASAGPPRYSVRLAELQQALAGRFPRSYPLAGVLELQLHTPQLALRPERDQLNAVIALQANGLLLQGRQPQGLLDVDFGLRYEASDRSLRTDRVQVNTLRLQGLPAGLSQQLSRHGASLAAKALDGLVLHQLRPSDLALADGLGVQPGPIRVTAQGLTVEFVPRR